MRLIDNAGNKSETTSINVYKDSTKPEIGQTMVDQITDTGFIMNIGTRDDLSGIGKYIYYITGKGETKEVEYNKNQRIFTGLTPETSYEVYAKVYDKAGNCAETVIIPVMTSKEGSGTGDDGPSIPGLKAPRIEVVGEKENGYYIGEVTIKIIDRSPDDETIAKRIKYTTNGMGYTEIKRAGETTEVKVNIDGNYTVNAYMLDETGMQSGMSNVVAFSRDQDPPTTAVITVTDVTSDTLGVLATGSDAVSGVKSYTFKKSTTRDGEYENVATINTGTGTCSYTYRELNTGTRYYLKVAVTDNRGLTRESGILISRTMVGAPKITNETGTGWAQSKTVSIQMLPGYTTMYTIDGTDPSATNGTAVTGKITLTEPKTIKAVFVQADTGNESDMSSLYVNKIDNLPPQAPTLKSHSMESGAVLNLKLNTKDNGESVRNSGVSQIRYKRPLSGTWSDWQSTSSSETILEVPIKFTAFESQVVNIEVELKDKVGNQSTKTHTLTVWPFNVLPRDSSDLLRVRTTNRKCH